MGNNLKEIAQQLVDSSKKCQLIYAFNGVGKTRLSGEFKELIAPKNVENDEDNERHVTILYYNAFTEDLFYWDNDLENDVDRKIKIHPNSFTDWLLKDEGQDKEVQKHFSHYANSKLSVNFDTDFSEVTFAVQGNASENIKISKSEESSFIWSIFYSMLELVIEQLNEEKENRSTTQFDALKYIFIDDPVTSLDENHLIELAVNLAEKINNSSFEKNKVKFIITTHNPLFFNVLCNGLKDHKKYRLKKNEDGTYRLDDEIKSPFSYHLFLLSEIQKAIESDSVYKYHFNLLRNILEKTAIFLGYANWSELLDPEYNKKYQKRLIDISCHSDISISEVPPVRQEDKDMLKELLQLLIEKYQFNLSSKENESEVHNV